MELTTFTSVRMLRNVVYCGSYQMNISMNVANNVWLKLYMYNPYFQGVNNGLNLVWLKLYIYNLYFQDVNDGLNYVWLNLYIYNILFQDVNNGLHNVWLNIHIIYIWYFTTTFYENCTNSEYGLIHNSSWSSPLFHLGVEEINMTS